MTYDDLGHADKLAARRTEMAFQRTRMAADRSLMAVMRTALSLIGFGFTIYTFFGSIVEKGVLGPALPERAPGRVGLALIAMGVLLLGLGIANHFRYMRDLRSQRRAMVADGMLPSTPEFPVSLALISALLLLLLGVLVGFGTLLRMGPLA